MKSKILQARLCLKTISSPYIETKLNHHWNVLFLFATFTITSHLHSATITTMGSGNWSSTTINAPWPLGIVPLATDDVIIGNGHTLTVDGNKTCKSVGFSNVVSGNATGTLTVNAGFLLNVTNSISCPGFGLPTKTTANYIISGAGAISAGSVYCNNLVAPLGSGNTVVSLVSTINSLTITDSLTLYSTYTSGGSKTNNSTFNIQRGTVNVIGSLVTINANSANQSVIDLVTSASGSVLTLSGTNPMKLSAIGTNTINLDGPGAIVNYNGTLPQTVLAYPYTNLTLSGAGTKTLSTGLSLSGDLSLGGAVSVTPATALNIPGNFTIGSGSSFDAGSYTHNITGNVTNNGSFNAGTSTINLNGTSGQIINGTATSVFNNLVVSNPSGVSLAAPVKINSFLSFGNVNNAVLSTNGLLTLASSIAGTAMLKDITNSGVNTGNSINGNVTVETYIQGKRSYRFLSAPVISTTSIRANWMENTNNTSTSINNNPNPNYGTHITGSAGSANGFDATGLNSPSLFNFNNVSQAWAAVANTSGVFTAGTAYRIMVRETEA